MMKAIRLTSDAQRGIVETAALRGYGAGGRVTVIDVACDYCGSVVGEGCRGKGGNLIARYHDTRIAKARQPSTAADRIRALHAADPQLTVAQIARMTGSARGAVYAAIKATPGRKGGRPRKGVDCPHCAGTGRLGL